MKNLHDLEEKRWQFQSSAFLDGIVRTVDHPSKIILLLHGLNERGRRIYRKLLPYLPDNATIIAPNGPFPLPRYKENRLDFGYAWYFYDRFKKEYVINQDLAKNWILEIIKMSNPDRLPVTIIGFSQGGYLAPLAGLLISETKQVIGVGCEFRENILPDSCPFPLIGIHGKGDEIIPHESSYQQLELLRSKGYNCQWYLVEDAKHEINQSIGHKVREILDGKARL